MAAKKKAKPRTTKVVTMSAEEKAARAGLVKSAQLGVAQNSARVRTASRGAVGSVNLRAAGTNLANYDMGKYSDTTKNVPLPPSGGAGSGSGTRRSTGGTKKSKPAPKKPVSRNEGPNKIPRKARETHDARAKYLEAERKRRIAAKKKADAAKKAKIVKQGGGGTGRAV